MKGMDNVVLRETAHILIPLILLYGLYVLFHGELAPGGGFQAGVVFSVGLMLFALIYGTEKLHRVISPPTAEFLAAFGLLLYAGVGVACMAAGGDFLDYDVLLPSPAAGQHLGIVLIEVGVAVTIIGVVTMVYSVLSGWVDAAFDDDV